MRKIKFWKDNKIVNKFILDGVTIKTKFIEWLKVQKHKDGYTREWLENMGTHHAVCKFVGDNETDKGLQSVCELDDYDILADLLKSDFWKYIETLAYKIK